MMKLLAVQCTQIYYYCIEFLILILNLQLQIKLVMITCYALTEKESIVRQPAHLRKLHNAIERCMSLCGRLDLIIGTVHVSCLDGVRHRTQDPRQGSIVVFAIFEAMCVLNTLYLIRNSENSLIRTVGYDPETFLGSQFLMMESSITETADHIYFVGYRCFQGIKK